MKNPINPIPKEGCNQFFKNRLLRHNIQEFTHSTSHNDPDLMD